MPDLTLSPLKFAHALNNPVEVFHDQEIPFGSSVVLQALQPVTAEARVLSCERFETSCKYGSGRPSAYFKLTLEAVK